MMKFWVSAGGAEESNSDSEVMKDWHDEAAFRAPGFRGLRLFRIFAILLVGRKLALLGICVPRFAASGLALGSQVRGPSRSSIGPSLESATVFPSLNQGCCAVTGSGRNSS